VQPDVSFKFTIDIGHETLYHLDSIGYHQRPLRPRAPIARRDKIGVMVCLTTNHHAIHMLPVRLNAAFARDTAIDHNLQ
jgi:hypothetical protein